MKNTDSFRHLRGESIYLDDIPLTEGTLFGLVYDSPLAHGKNLNIDYSKAISLKGVVDIITYKDIPGDNQIGAIIKDEMLFAETEVHYIGQPIALIIAESERIARDAKKLIKFKAEELLPVTDPKISKDKKDFILPPRTFHIGNIKKGEEKSKYIVEGTTSSGGQEHLYLETQGAYSCPKENGNITLYSSTQSPTAVQRIAARVLNYPMNKIEVDVNRLGGGFGGKEDQATSWACMAALASIKLNKPVKINVSRHDDMRLTGKRHPYTSKYKIGISKDLSIQFYEVEFLQDAGASADLSPAIMERTLFHASGSYYIPNAQITVFSCKTNTPPNTAFRGFGAPQAFFTIESAIDKAATVIGVETKEIQRKNLLKDNDKFPYGQKSENSKAIETWEYAEKQYKIEQKYTDVKKFNLKNIHLKKGISMMPICFGISFTNTVMNHARALVHVYQDGSVGISTGAIEMGQGVNTKLKQVAAKVFGISVNKIKIESTNTSRVANTSPTAASTGADLNGKALTIATKKIVNRLLQVAADHFYAKKEEVYIKNEEIFYLNKKTDLTWTELIKKAHLKRINLSEKAHYATPKIWFDKSKEKGHPFSYHVYGTAVTLAIVDTLRGTYEIESVEIIHDFGKSMNFEIDKGQIEGALIQSIGWHTTEEIIHDKNGKLMSNALSTYKIPDIYSAPGKVTVLPLLTEGHQLALLKSKAVGEPPFIYGTGAYFAIKNAVKAFNPDYKNDYILPVTHEKVLLGLYQHSDRKINN